MKPVTHSGWLLMWMAMLCAPCAQAASPDAGRSITAEAGAIYGTWLKPGPPPLERFVKPLALTAAQQEQLKPIFVAAQDRAARDDAARSARAEAPSPNEIREELATREADFRVQLATVLTAVQLRHYDELSSTFSELNRGLDPQPGHGHSGAMN